MAARPVGFIVTILVLIGSNTSDELVLPNSQTNTNTHQILNHFHKDDLKLTRLKDDVREYNIGIDMDEGHNDEEHNVNLKLNMISESNEEITESTGKKQANTDSSKMKQDRLKNGEHKMYIDLHVAKEMDNMKLKAILNWNEATIEIKSKNKPSIESSMREFKNTLPEDGVKIIKDILNFDKEIKAENSRFNSKTIAFDVENFGKDIIEAQNSRFNSKTLVFDVENFGKDIIEAQNSRFNSKTIAFDVDTLERVKRDSEYDDIIIWDYCEGKTHLEYIDGKFECVEVSFENRSNTGSLVNCPYNTRRVILHRRVVLCRPIRRKH